MKSVGWSSCWQDWGDLEYFTIDASNRLRQLRSLSATMSLHQSPHFEIWASTSTLSMWTHVSKMVSACFTTQPPVSHSTSSSVIGCSFDTDASQLRLFYDGRSSCTTAELTQVGSPCSCSTRLLSPVNGTDAFHVNGVTASSTVEAQYLGEQVFPSMPLRCATVYLHRL